MKSRPLPNVVEGCGWSRWKGLDRFWRGRAWFQVHTTFLSGVISLRAWENTQQKIKEFDRVFWKSYLGKKKSVSRWTLVTWYTVSQEHLNFNGRNLTCLNKIHTNPRQKPRCVSSTLVFFGVVFFSWSYDNLSSCYSPYQKLAGCKVPNTACMSSTRTGT